MSLVLINVGTIPNDHTGDPFRTAFIKTNSIISALNTGPLTIGPPLASGINLTIDQGPYESNSTPGIFVRGDTGSQAAISIGANGTTPGVASYDLQQDVGGNGYIVLRGANTTLAIWTSNTPHVFIGPSGRVLINPPTADVSGLIVFGNNVGGVSGVALFRSTDSARIVTFDCTQATAGWIAIERSGSDKSFWGDSSLLSGGSLDDYTLRSNAGLDLASGGGNRRINIATSGAVTIFAPSSDVSSLSVNGAAGSGVQPAMVVGHTSTGGQPFYVQASAVTRVTGFNSNAANGPYSAWGRSGADKAFFGDDSVLTGGSIDDYTLRSNAALKLASGGGNTRVSIASTGEVTVVGKLGVNNTTPPAKVTGFGVPTGTGVINNFSGGAATLPQCSQAIAQLITDLKNFGLYGA